MNLFPGPRALKPGATIEDVREAAAEHFAVGARVMRMWADYLHAHNLWDMVIGEMPGGMEYAFDLFESERTLTSFHFTREPGVLTWSFRYRDKQQEADRGSAAE